MKSYPAVTYFLLVGFIVFGLIAWRYESDVIHIREIEIRQNALIDTLITQLSDCQKVMRK